MKSCDRIIPVALGLALATLLQLPSLGGLSATATAAPATGNSMTPLASASSSDTGGGQITYQTQTALMLMNADGSGRTKLPVQIGFPSWTADGSQLLQWSGQGPAVLMNADGTHRQNVPMPGHEPVVSPDGKNVAFEGANGVGVYVETIGGKNVRKITSLSPLLRDPGVTWSPDSQSVIFSGPRADPTKGCSDIYIFSADGGAWAQVPVTIPGTDPQCILPTFTPDGKDIVFYGYDIDSQTNKRIDSRIYSVPISGGAASAVPGSEFASNSTGAFLPRVSPDGTLIAFMSITTGTSPVSELETIPIGGGSVTNLGAGILWPWRRSPLTVNQTSNRYDTPTALASGICNVGDPSTPGHECTLRAAIQVVNAAPSKPQTIRFDIPGGGIPTITPSAPLPAVTTKGITLDAASQPGGWVDLSGAGVKGGSTDGLTLSAAEDVVQGFAIGGFSGDGILIDATAGGDSVSGNRIGTTASGTAADPNVTGVDIADSPNNTVGGSAAADGNLISGNEDSKGESGHISGVGVLIDGTSSNGNKVEGNQIGTGLGGIGSMPNSDDGVVVLDASNNTIGGQTNATGTSPGNIIAGGTRNISFASGVLIAGQNAPADTNVVVGNSVGIDSSGHLTPASEHGVLVAGQASGDVIGDPVKTGRNVVTGASREDIGIESTRASGHQGAQQLGRDEREREGGSLRGKKQDRHRHRRRHVINHWYFHGRQCRSHA